MGKKRFEKAQLKRKLKSWEQKFEEEHRLRLSWQERLKEVLEGWNGTLERNLKSERELLDIIRKNAGQALKWEFSFWISNFLWCALSVVVLVCQGQ